MGTVGQFMQVKRPAESTDKISFAGFQTSAQMASAYLQDPVAYIREACRLDPPVTSCTSILGEPVMVSLNGKPRRFEAGTYRQYTISMANRDPSVFDDPELFDPKRKNLT